MLHGWWKLQSRFAISFLEASMFRNCVFLCANNCPAADVIPSYIYMLEIVLQKFMCNVHVIPIFMVCWVLINRTTICFP
uniref:Uncharacterized protein n=1 Tax=Anguilla anguilla TaxID=7936 RepID=A0A0E9X6V5_ANGAN